MPNNFPGKSNNYFQLRTFDNEKGEIILSGVLSEMPTIGLSTNWEDAPISTIANKTKEFFMGDLFKAVGFIGGNENYQNQLNVGKWSAREYTGTNFGEFDLKFRIYEGNGLEHSSSIREWARSLSEYAVLNADSELHFDTLFKNIKSGLSSLENNENLYELFKMILGGNEAAESEEKQKEKGEKITNILENGCIDKNGNKIPTWSDKFSEYKKEWITKKGQELDIEFKKEYGREFTYDKDGSWKIDISDYKNTAALKADKKEYLKVRVNILKRVKDGAKISYDGPDWFGEWNDSSKHKFTFYWSQLDLDVPGVWNDKWGGSSEDVTGIFDFVTYHIDVGKAVQEYKKDSDWSNDMKSSSFKELFNDYKNLLDEFFSYILNRMNDDYLKTLVSNQKLKEIYNQEINAKNEDPNTLSNRILGEFKDHDRVEKKFNKKNGLGAKIWYLDLYQNWLFTKPLVVGISDWKIKPSKEIYGHNGKSYYYDITIHCIMDQIPTAHRWQYIFEGTVDNEISLLNSKLPNKPPEKKAKYDDEDVTKL